MRYAHMLRGLIVLNGLGLRVPGTTAADALRLDPEQTRAHLFADLASETAHRIVPDLPATEILPAYLKTRQTLARFAWQFPDNPKLARYLYRVTIPTLILWGAHDQFIPSAHGRAYHDAIVDSEWVLLPKSGHLPQAEQPQACVDAVLAYLARHGLGG